ncbi:MAG: DUF123 domain-containing protein [Anaerolineae bacterium]|jgi:Uri superfamily endonuclease
MGTYVLALWLDRPQNIIVGRLGEFRFPAGWYLYVGSALGPGGLPSRLARHLRRVGADKQAHWHIDYLREATAWIGAWGRTCDQRWECTWSVALRSLPDARIVAPGFGASDCDCPAHLVHLSTLPDSQWFIDTLGAKRIIVKAKDLNKLLEALTTGSDESREAAALALGQFGTDAVEPLIEILTGGAADARWWAARALAEIGGDSTVAPLMNTLGDPDPDMRACAALALGRIGAGAGASALQTAASAVAALLADESAFVASIAADALSMIGEPAVEALTEKLTVENPHTRLLAVRALGRIKSPHAIGPLFGLLEDPSYLVRYYAHEALEALGVGMVLMKP